MRLARHPALQCLRWYLANWLRSRVRSSGITCPCGSGGKLGISIVHYLLHTQLVLPGKSTGSAGSLHPPVKLLKPIRHSVITAEATLTAVLCLWGPPPGLHGLQDQKGSDCFLSRSAPSWVTSAQRALGFPRSSASQREGLWVPGPQASSSGCCSTARRP